MNIYLGGEPMDAARDAFLAHLGIRNLSVFTEEGSDTVYLVIGDPEISAILIYSNTVLLAEPQGSEGETRLSGQDQPACYCYPNPFDGETVISYALCRECRVELSIFNLCGQEVCTLVSEWQAPGMHRVIWDASGLPEGMYLYRLRTGLSMQTGKLILAY